MITVLYAVSFSVHLPAQDAPPAPPAAGTQDVSKEIESLRSRLEALEKRVSSGGRDEVDLSANEVPYGAVKPPSHPLARPWHENVSLGGFGAFDFLATGKDGTRPHGGFMVKEASIFLEAMAWEHLSFYADIQLTHLGEDEDTFIRPGELYANLRDVLGNGKEDLLGIKAGRFYLPFGEEYRWQRSPDNPLITNSAAFPYGLDEGILLYGKAGGLGWAVAVTDGTDARSIEDNWDKAVNVKLHGSPWAPLYLSASFMRDGRSAESAFEFGGSNIQPVGASHASTMGSSPSKEVEAYLYELDARWGLWKKGYLAFSFGQAFVDDRQSSFDRDILWFSAEALYQITARVYAVVRYSEVGTYRSGEGYHFDGEITAGGNDAFGYDTRRLQRLSLGLGWRPHPHLLVKAEVGADRFEVITGSPFRPNDSGRVLAGLELVLQF